MSNKQYDINGYLEVKDNPLSAVGVYEYLGADIPNAPKPDEIYYVFRSEEELSDPECIASFKKVPITEDHLMLGDNFTPPEDKGVEGTTGDAIYFESPYLKGDIKIFSTSLKKKIEQGKKELSCGYRCVYEYSPGEWNGQKYDYIQRRIRGNHIALVQQGRMGAEVAVLDSAVALDHFKITLDEGFIPMEPKENERAVKVEDMTPEEKAARIAELEAELQALKADPATDEGQVVNEPAKDAEIPTEENIKEVAVTAQVAAEEASQAAQEAQQAAATAQAAGNEAETIANAIDPEKLDAAMDAKINAAFKAKEKDFLEKSTLYEKVSPIVGAFDHSMMNSQQLAGYACKKLSMDVEKGQEKAALNGYLTAYKAPKEVAVAQDSGITLNCLKDIKVGV